MKKLTHFAMALANNTLSTSAMLLVKGGTDNQNGNQDGNQNGSQNTNIVSATDATEDEKRRQRPGGGGISTN
jgi:hypothetical protein